MCVLRAITVGGRGGVGNNAYQPRQYLGDNAADLGGVGVGPVGVGGGGVWGVGGRYH